MKIQSVRRGSRSTAAAFVCLLAFVQCGDDAAVEQEPRTVEFGVASDPPSNAASRETPESAKEDSESSKANKGKRSPDPETAANEAFYDERFDDAMALIETALQAGGSVAKRQSLYTRAALFANALDDVPAARGFLAKAQAAIENMPEDKRAWGRRQVAQAQGNVHLSDGMLDLARVAFQQAKKHFAQSLGDTLNEFRLTMVAGDRRGGRRLLERVLEKLPAEPRYASTRQRLELEACRIDRKLGRDPAELKRRLDALAGLAPEDAKLQRGVQLQRVELALTEGKLDVARAALAEVMDWYLERQFRGARGLSCLRSWTRVELALAKRDPSVVAGLQACRPHLLARWHAVLERWDSVPRHLGGVGFLQYFDRRDLLSLLLSVELQSGDRDPAARFGYLFEAERRDTLARRLDPEGRVTGLALGALSDLAPADGGVLVYVPARVGSHVVAFTRDGLARGEIAHFEIAGDQLVADHVGPLRAALWEGEPRERLDELMAPVQRWALPEHVREHIADWKSLVITGRELADGLPFEALADQGGRRLGETRAVSHLPSLLVGQLLGARPLASTQRALPSAAVFAVTEPESDAAALHRLAPLRLDSEPLLVRNGQVVATQQGSAASRVAFAKTGSDPGSMLYLIAHGVRVGEWERPGGLVLADHVLSCDDVESVAAPRFVMLLSCGAGRALRRRGDSSGHHFGGAFLFAGASSVVFSDADLELDPAVALMRAFDAALPKCGWRPAEALRRARAAVTRNPATAHPRYSAVVRIEGLAQRSLLP